ncbi:MAG: ABC transporter ATP-binding protein [Dethiobacteria bacterium]|jgi:ABC-type nitrate/sulfonate/bicarbonate transport system ATPase subunit
MDSKLEVRKVSKRYNRIKVLQDISLSVMKKQFVSILGPSGCGKSTLFEVISGLQLPDNGEVLIDGKDSRGRTGRVSYMPQKDLLLPWKTILDNAALPLVIKGESWPEARRKAAPYFAPFELDGFERAYPQQLSGGMRQRAALLRTFLFARDILLLDEPFGALDALTRSKMHLWLLDIFQRYDPSVLFITHDIDEAIFLADKLYIFSARPARVVAEIEIELPRPRSQELLTSGEFAALKKEVLQFF